jgi:hypothetical protein
MIPETDSAVKTLGYPKSLWDLGYGHTERCAWTMGEVQARLLQVADDHHHFALDLDLPRIQVQGLHRGVGRLQAHTA